MNTLVTAVEIVYFVCECVYLGRREVQGCDGACDMVVSLKGLDLGMSLC